MPGQLAALARLRALRHLDLQLVRVDQVFRSNTEASRSHLLDLRTQRIALLHRDVDDDARDARLERFALAHERITSGILATFAGIRFAADAVHRDRQRRVCLCRDRAQAHRAGRKALDDVGCRLDLVQRHGLACELEFEQAAQRHHAAGLVVDEFRVVLVCRIALRARRVLQLGHRVRCPHVLLAASAVLVFATGVERVLQYRTVAECEFVQPVCFGRHFSQPDALDVAGGPREILLHERGIEADGLENLRAAIGLVCRNPHLRHHLVQALANRLDEALGRLFRGNFRNVLMQLCERFEREIRMHGLGTVAGKKRELMHFAGGAGFHHQARARAQALAHEVLMHGGGSEQRRDGHAFRRHLAVGNDQNVVPETGCILGVRAQARKRGLHAGRTPCRGIADIQLERPEARAGEQLDMTDLFHLVRRQDRLLRLEAHRWIGLVDAEQIRPRADERHQRHHQFFPDRVDGRIGHLREQLLEVVVENLGSIRQHGQRRVVAHRAGGFLAVLRHRCEDDLHVLLRVAEGLLPIEQRDFGTRRWRRVRQRVERDA